MSEAEEVCQICFGEGWVCENHEYVRWYYGDGCSCGGAGMPCKCNTSNPPWHYKDLTVIEEREEDE